MTTDEVRKALKNYLQIKIQVNLKRSILEMAREDYNTLHGTCYSRDVVQGGLRESVVDRAVLRMLRIEEEYKDACEKMFIAESSINSMMQYLTDVEQQLVVDRYMNDINDFCKLSRKYFYTVSTIKDKFNNIYKKIARAN